MTTQAGYRWRIGRKVGRTIYAQVGPKPSSNDILIGVMDTRLFAQEVVGDHNRRLKEVAEQADVAVSLSGLEQTVEAMWESLKARVPARAPVLGSDIEAMLTAALSTGQIVRASELEFWKKTAADLSRRAEKAEAELARIDAAEIVVISPRKHVALLAGSGEEVTDRMVASAILAQPTPLLSWEEMRAVLRAALSEGERHG